MNIYVQNKNVVLFQGPCKRNGLKDIEVDKKSGGESATCSKKAAASRFTIGKGHKASRRKKEKSSAKRERKATKTLAIVLGKGKIRSIFLKRQKIYLHNCIHFQIL